VNDSVLNDSLKNYALISVSNKEGLSSIARVFLDKGYHLLATGNTFRVLQSEGFEVTEVSDFTGEPERFGGRVKTLHHKILGSILFRPGKDESEWPFDCRIGAVVCNFYPIQEKGPQQKELSALMEWVDIGGPTMVRAAAKNHDHVWILTDPSQYARFITQYGTDDGTLRKRFALEAFDLMLSTDEEVLRHFERIYLGSMGAGELRYGENPHQSAHFMPAFRKGLKVYGDFSYNNWRDAEAAFRFVRPFIKSTACVIKHQTICGACVAGLNFEGSDDEIFQWAWDGDDKSRFGGVIALNFEPSEKITEEVFEKKFIEMLILPRTDSSEKWAEAMFAKKPKMKILLVESNHWKADHGDIEVMQGALGRCVQKSDAPVWPFGNELSNEGYFLEASQWMAACSKSNAMVLVGIEDDANWLVLAGAGQGQPNRVDALERLAIPRAKEFCARTQFPWSQLICVSDGFLPFSDSVEILAKAEILKLVQPGGSKADQDVHAKAQELGVDMVVTGTRHFWH
jgi:phosphoribosylaminoimidazolecarboxamide formyltransferase / IMP cyclohydrolase